MLRVAGGWVRDKLLGRPSDDIDITMDGVTGADFAAMIRAYLCDTVRLHREHVTDNPCVSAHQGLRGSRAPRSSH